MAAKVRISSTHKVANWLKGEARPQEERKLRVGHRAACLEPAPLSVSLLYDLGLLLSCARTGTQMREHSDLLKVAKGQEGPKP